MAPRPDNIDDEGVVGRELRRLRDLISEEARRHRVIARRWMVAFVAIGGAAALTSGSAAVTASSDSGADRWVVVLAVAGGGLGALATALNPGGRWEQARTVALTLTRLAHELETFIGLQGADLRGTGRQTVEDVVMRFDAILGVPERTRLWADDAAPARRHTLPGASE